MAYWHIDGLFMVAITCYNYGFSRKTRSFQWGRNGGPQFGTLLCKCGFSNGSNGDLFSKTTQKIMEIHNHNMGYENYIWKWREIIQCGKPNHKLTMTGYGVYNPSMVVLVTVHHWAYHIKWIYTWRSAAKALKHQQCRWFSQQLDNGSLWSSFNHHDTFHHTANTQSRIIMKLHR